MTEWSLVGAIYTPLTIWIYAWHKREVKQVKRQIQHVQYVLSTCGIVQGSTPE